MAPIKPLIEHTDNCISAPRRKKCHLCLRNAEKQRKQQYRSKNKVVNELKIKTRIKPYKPSKYAHILCPDCKGKGILKGNLCNTCRLAYIRARNNASKHMKQLKVKCQVKSESQLNKLKSKQEKLKNNICDLQDANITNKYAVKTIANNKSFCNNALGSSPTKKEEVLSDMILDLPAENQKKID